MLPRHGDFDERVPWAVANRVVDGVASQRRQQDGIPLRPTQLLGRIEFNRLLLLGWRRMAALSTWTGCGAD